MSLFFVWIILQFHFFPDHRCITMAFDNSHNDKDCLEPIAIVGLSLRFPAGATDLDRFFNLITEARCVSQAFPSDRLDVTGAYWPKAAAAVPTVSGGHFLAEDITAFDAPFFGISAVEAASMDPQQRLLLETSYVALENGRRNQPSSPHSFVFGMIIVCVP